MARWHGCNICTIGFKDKDSGKLAGFDIDIINAIAKEEGIEADIQT